MITRQLIKPASSICTYLLGAGVRDTGLSLKT